MFLKAGPGLNPIPMRSVPLTKRGGRICAGVISRHRVAAEMVMPEVGARRERVHPAHFEQLVEAVFG